MIEILKLLEQNPDLTNDQIAQMLSTDPAQVAQFIDQCKQNQIILGNKMIIDWDKTDRELVTALIEVKITPMRGVGFDRVAQRIYQYPEVDSVYLMSGGFDLTVIIEGTTLKDVAMFVAEKLSTLEQVSGTATHFVLKKYKDKGVMFTSREPQPERVDGIL